MLDSMMMVLVWHSLLEMQDDIVKQIFIPCLEKETPK